ncbi:MAG: hypothetical protein J6X60_09750, partial [Ruminiclostridium sp.]|nr:hypothetical protein [Ruminiclostridium sp.]
MRSYYHCLTARYRRRRAALVTVFGSVAAEAAVISFIVLFFSLFGSDGAARLDTVRITLMTASFFTAAGLAACFLSAFICDRKTARHSRYTYLDIQEKAAVISVYSGEMNILGRKAVFRELYLIPFAGFVSAAPSANGRKYTIRGKIRHYGMESDHLGYHIKNGDICFDNIWLNTGSFEELGEAVLPARFGSPARICGVLTKAKKRFDELPKPKKYEFREADFIRRRP